MRLILGLTLLARGIASAQVTLSMDSGNAVAGTSTKLDLSMSGSQPAALQWSLTYPTSTISSVIFSASPTAQAAGKTLNCATGTGFVSCVLYGLNMNAIPSGMVAAATVTSRTNAVGNVQLSLSFAASASAPGLAIATAGSGGTLRVSQPNFSISGSISSGGGSSVALSGAASQTTTADSSGNYSFIGLPNGGYTITPTKSGFNISPANKAVTINGSNATAINFAATQQLTSGSFYVSPTGNPRATGSISDPLDITTVFQTLASRIRPGETVWLRGGTYGTGGSTVFTSSLMGTASSPIYIRQYPGERATINGGLNIAGKYAWYWGFEIANLNWSFSRTTSTLGVSPPGKPSDAIFFSPGAIGNKIINMIIHDAAGGIADLQAAMETEEYGNLIYNNGWVGPDGGHGSNLALQNGGSAPKLVEDNIGYGAFESGIRADGVNAGTVASLHLSGNVAFNSGQPANHRLANILMQGGGIEKDIVVSNGVFYNPSDAAPGETGYNAFDGKGIDLALTNNYWIGAPITTSSTLRIANWQTVGFNDNTIVGPLQTSSVIINNWSNNSYFQSAPPPGIDSASAISSSPPTGITSIVRPNKYELGRANLIVLNWDKNPTVTVDISSAGLSVGTPFEVRDSQNFWGPAVLSAVYDGNPITLPTRFTGVSTISGPYPAPTHTSEEFNAFVVLKQGIVAAPPQIPAPLISLSKYSLTFTGVAGSAPALQFVTLRNAGSQNTLLNWIATSNQSWLSVSPASGQYGAGIGGDIRVSISTTGLGPGAYQGTITISDISGASSTQTIAVMLTLSPPPAPAPQPLITGYTLGTIRSDYSGWVGMRFVVGNTPLSVSELGRLNAPGNSGVHILKLVNASTGADVPGGAVSITAGGSTGTFKYGALSAPVILAANTAYYLASLEVAGQDQWYDLNTTVRTSSAASVTSGAYFWLWWLTQGGDGNAYGPVSLTYTVRGSQSPSSGTSAAFVTAQSLGTPRKNYDGFVGMQFRTASTAITVTAVGRYVTAGNAGNHLVKIVNASTGQDVPGASAVVVTAGATAGSYSFAPINPVVLNPNTSYYILSQETGGGDLWYDYDTSVQTTEAATAISAVYLNGTRYYPMASYAKSYGPVNFQYK